MLKKLMITGALCGILYSAEAQNFRTVQEASKYYEELVGTLSQQVRSLQDENAKLTATVYQLQRQFKALEQSSQLYARDIQSLRKMIEEESQTRSKQLNGIADRVQKAADRSSAEVPRKNDEGASVEYDIYEVQRGATLTAIAKKAGVSVQDIMRANNMSSTSLRVGQKLKIPRK